MRAQVLHNHDLTHLIMSWGRCSVSRNSKEWETVCLLKSF